MSTFHPSKLSVTLHPPATFSHPVTFRKYTLTHSDEIGDVFLDIGFFYNERAMDVIIRDEVLAEWRSDGMGNFYLKGKVQVDIGEIDKKRSEFRLTIFQKEMETAIKGIVFGDKALYANYPALLDSPIFIHYQSIFPEYNKILFYGTPRQYLRNIYE